MVMFLLEYKLVNIEFLFKDCIRSKRYMSSTEEKENISKFGFINQIRSNKRYESDYIFGRAKIVHIAVITSFGLSVLFGLITKTYCIQYLLYNSFITDIDMDIWLKDVSGRSMYYA
jgi:hypothetical protein